MESQVSSQLTISRDTALVIDFAVALGREVMVCGGEMWRVEQVLNDIFGAYHLIETSIYMDVHTLIISGRRENESHVIRQTQIGDIASEMERLTRLTRLTGKVCRETPPPAPSPAARKTPKGTGDWPGVWLCPPPRRRRGRR